LRRPAQPRVPVLRPPLENAFSATPVEPVEPAEEGREDIHRERIDQGADLGASEEALDPGQVERAEQGHV
jgi:hypothetical protein